VIRALAEVPRDGRAGAALVAFVACSAGVVNWGLGLIVGAILAREVGRSLARRGARFSYPLLAAAGYTTMMVWHGGLSGSAPLSVTTVENAAKSLPATVLAAHAPPSGAWIGLQETLGSRLNLVVTAGLLVIVPLVMAMLCPKGGGEVGRLPRAIEGSERVRGGEAAGDGARAGAIPEWLETSRGPAWALGAISAAMLALYVRGKGIGTIGLNEINLGDAGHGALLSRVDARVHQGGGGWGASGCVGVILQFPLYAGIMSMMQQSGLVRLIAEGMVSVADARSMPVFSFLAAGVVNLFVPSGGGQWAVQGPIAIETAAATGTPLGKAVMSIAYGDQLTNMLQPFWALPLLAITGVKAREIVGYTACAMVVGGVWMGLMLYIL
jgi:short-chain fatty acids transporter